MGHHHENHPVYNHREALLIQRRIVSFLLVFSVMAVAFVILIASVQTREASCQTRAEVAIYSMAARPTEDNDTLISSIIVALKERGVQLELADEDDEVYATRQIDVLDTAERTLWASGFRLLRWTGANNVLWQLRFLDQSLCQTGRGISMEALPNVDYEKVTHKVRSVGGNNGNRAFLYEVNVMTKDKKRITTFPQLQSLFPGFNAQVASPRMVVTRSFRRLRNFAADLYHGETMMDIELRVEMWGRPDGNALFWRVQLLSRNILAEINLKEIYNVLAEVLQSRNIMCDREGCGNAYDDAFLQ
ncbi:hypothetical protein DQ04_00551030 [Trypanosoma grayi]|uniref:hypothetical protein n=1 Tax=Trypanosoma grayi TaxID=71804 RepID=UPI0004F403D5|nr:hypothetical protein DQ04_00551030 [Trypanosoma grayi]KEG14251.1 hypothetical protein DQ04_00551030 [Trypanosoma grayi]